MDIDRQGPRFMSNNCQHLDTPYFSLPTIFNCLFVSCPSSPHRLLILRNDDSIMWTALDTQAKAQDHLILYWYKKQERAWYRASYSTYSILTNLEIDFIDTDNNNDIRALDSFYLKVLRPFGLFGELEHWIFRIDLQYAWINNFFYIFYCVIRLQPTFTTQRRPFYLQRNSTITMY